MTSLIDAAERLRQALAERALTQLRATLLCEAFAGNL
jgi:hypothetical protein